jgi:hypothetical protein
MNENLEENSWKFPRIIHHGETVEEAIMRDLEEEKVAQ